MIEILEKIDDLTYKVKVREKEGKPVVVIEELSLVEWYILKELREIKAKIK